MPSAFTHPLSECFGWKLKKGIYKNLLIFLMCGEKLIVFGVYVIVRSKNSTVVLQLNSRPSSYVCACALMLFIRCWLSLMSPSTTNKISSINEL